MIGQLSHFLGPHAERVADVMRRPRAGTESRPHVADDHEPRVFIDAVLMALTTDDLHPLTAFFELSGERLAGIEERLDTSLRRLAVLRRATLVVAAEEMDEAALLSLAENTAEEAAVLGRRLVKSVTGTLAERLRAVMMSSAARGATMGTTLHELRQPLTILSSYGQLLSGGLLGQLPDTAMVAVEGIIASTEMMVRMVNAIAEVSRLEDPDNTLNFEVIPIKEIVAAAVDDMSMEARLRDIVIDTDVVDGVTIRGDRRGLTLAVTNMVGNAVKYGPEGSRVTVRAFGDASRAHFSVRDQGAGFPGGDAGHLFEKYFRSVDERQRKIPGSGLGLFIVKTVAERHNGSVSARSEPGEGAEFEMIIPIHH